MKEEDIRKRDVFNRYLYLVKEDVKSFFANKAFIEMPCLACFGDDITPAFEKLGFHYVVCKNCGTLFANPRPGFDVLDDFYTNSPSMTFWVNDFFKPVAEVRRAKIFLPRAESVSKLIDSNNKLVGDIGAGFGIFLDELRKIKPQNNYIAVEPSLKMADICKEKGFEVMCSCLEEIDGFEDKFDLLTAFELLEHLYEPASFLYKIYSLLKPGGYLYLTTLNGMGFDILLLWEKSKSVYPPHHLNFFNINSIQLLMKKVGFSIVEVATPGKLDWDIVEGMLKNENVDCGRFWNYVSREGSKSCKNELQDWISDNHLSSHMRVIAKKPL